MAELSEEEITSTKARLVARSKDMLWMRDTLINIRDELETDVDRVFFGSTNDADDFREIVDKLDDWQWSVITKDAEGEDLLAKTRELRATIASQAKLIKEARAEICLILENAEATASPYADRVAMMHSAASALYDKLGGWR